MRGSPLQKWRPILTAAGLLGFNLSASFLTAEETGAAAAVPIEPVSGITTPSERPAESAESNVLRQEILNLIPGDRHYREEFADALTQAYSGRGFRPLWSGGLGLDSLHREICASLNSHALPEPMALDPSNIAAGIQTDVVAREDLAASIAILDAALLIRLGHVPTEMIWPQWNSEDTPGEDARDFDSIANDLIRASSLTPFDMGRIMDEMGPKNWIYRELRKAYPEAKKSILSYSGLPGIPDPATAGVGKPGEAYPYASAIGTHLVDRGYLEMPEEQLAALSQITPELETALKAFQEDHGLDADGVFGPASWRYLNTNAASRFRSIVINLNRARLLPADFGERYILVNLPSAELYGFEDHDFHTTTMRIVHGKAEKDTHHTPVFRDVMKEVVFGPYWNVPPSIAEKEILPKAQGDWGFLSRNRYEIVSDFNPYNKDTHRLSPQNLELVAQGRLFFRQLPGPTNSLGRVKFLFPNSNNIYMHDTPAKALFARSNRDYSHGCIRVAKPQELGAYVLGAQGWTSEEVEEAMFAEFRKSEQVDEDINIFIVYFTTFPRPVFGGKIVMAPGRDVYDLDPIDSKTLSAVLPWVEPDNPTSPSDGQ